MFLAGKGKGGFGAGFDFHDMICLVAEFLKEVASFCLEGSGIGKNGSGERKRRKLAQTFERVFK